MKRSIRNDSGFPCPECQSGTEVKETRTSLKYLGTRRRRRCCLNCGHKFSTIEMLESALKPVDHESEMHRWIASQVKEGAIAS